MSSFIGGIFTAYKDTKIIGKTTIIAAVINLIVNIICIKYIGIWAAATSTLFAMLINYYLRNKRIKKYIELKSDYAQWVAIIFLIIDLISFYSNRISVNSINFIIILFYCIFINKKMLCSILDSLKKKVTK